MEMSSKSANKKIAKNTILLYIRQIITLCLSLYTSRLTLQVLGVSDFGIYAAVGGVTAFLSILTSSLSSSSQRFLTYSLGSGDYKVQNETYITSVNIHLILGLVLLLFAETVGLWFVCEKMTIPPERFDVTLWVYQLSVFGAFIMVQNAPNTAEIVAHEDMGPFAFFSIIDAVLKLFGVIGLMFIEYDRLLAYAFILFFIQIINPIVALVYCRRKYQECRYICLFDVNLTKSMVSLAGWNAISSFAIMGFIQGSNVLLNVFFGPIINSAYAVASQAYSGIRSFTSNFQLASNPQIVKLYSKGEKDEMHRLLINVCKYSFYLIFLLSYPFVLNANTILKIWLKEVPMHSASFFILLLVYSYFDVMAYPLDIAAQATGKIKKYCLYTSWIITLILPVSYFVFKLGGAPEYLLIVALSISILCLLVRLKLLSDMIQLSIIRFFEGVVLKIVPSVCLICFITIPFYFLVNDTYIWQTLVFFIYIVLVEIAIVYKVGLSKNERKLVVETIVKINK